MTSNKKDLNRLSEVSFYKKKIFWLPLLIFVIINFLPNNIINLLITLDDATLNVSQIIPSIKKIEDSSAFPLLSRVLFCFSWLLVPYYIIFFSKDKLSEKEFVKHWVLKKSVIKKNIGILSILFFFIIVIYFFLNRFYFSVREECVFRCAYDSRILQTFYAFCIPVVIGMIASGIIWWIRNYKNIYFK